MNTILIATDFSAAARNAAVFGATLAREFNANIHLLHAYQLVTPIGFDVPVLADLGDIRTEVIQKLEQETDLLKPSQNTQFFIEAVEGPTPEVITDYATEHNADLIVLGKTFDGNTIPSLSNSGKHPLLLIPEAATFTVPQTITLAVSAEDNLQSLPASFNVLNEFVTKFSPEISVVHVSSIEADTEIFEKTSNTNMIVLFSHHHSWFENIFTRDSTRKLSHKLDMPILILPQTERKINLIEEFEKGLSYLNNPK